MKNRLGISAKHATLHSKDVDIAASEARDCHSLFVLEDNFSFVPTARSPTALRKYVVNTQLIGCLQAKQWRVMDEARQALSCSFV